MPMNPADYPPNWNEISKQAREAAGQQCQQCGVTNGAVGARDRFGAWHDEDDIHGMNSDVGYDLFDGEFPKMTRIVLTCHHPDGDTANPNARLEVLCQKHHLERDRETHLRKAAQTRCRRKMERTGQQPLPLVGAGERGVRDGYDRYLYATFGCPYDGHTTTVLDPDGDIACPWCGTTMEPRAVGVVAVRTIPDPAPLAGGRAAEEETPSE